MTLSFANSKLKIGVRPDLGGRLDSLLDLRTGKEWLWHPQDYRGHRPAVKVGDNFDDHWTGGWEEMFPNDAAACFQGHELTDHGELWSQSWETVEQTDRGVKMALSCVTVPVDVEKTIELDPKDARFTMTYLFKNRSPSDLPFHFKLHPALAIEAGDEILLPRAQIEPVALGFSSLIAKEGKTTFPHALGRDDRQISLRQVLPRDTNEQEFVYASDLAEGWCGLKNQRTNSSLVISFDKTAVPYVWLFMSYGKWRNHYVMMIEPCTNVPWDLEAAYRQGTCATLPSRGWRDFRFEVSLENARG